jgi:nucleoside-diphosphate-sugar epimerase
VFGLVGHFTENNERRITRLSFSLPGFDPNSDYNVTLTMRIFLTGATGYIGSAVLEALLRGGHTVVALVRDPEKAEHLKLRGVHAIVGDMAVPKYYAAAAEGCDSIIHAALELFKRGPDVDRQAVDALLGAAIRRSAKGQAVSFVYTSGVWVLGNTAGAAGEDAPVRPTPLVAWLPDHEQLILDAGRGRMLRTAVVRPGIVYGGARGIIADLLRDAANGLLRVVGDGRNRWACVYDRDLADLYLRVATMPEASGIYHANDEADERVADIVEAVARHAKMQPDVRHVPITEARAKMGPYADALALNQIVRSARSKELGWGPALHSVSGNVPRVLEEFRAARMAAA